MRFLPHHFPGAVGSFVGALAEIPNLNEHQYGIDLRQAGITIRVVTLRDDYMGMTERDLELAQQISAVAHDHGLIADPSRIQSLLIIPGAPDITKVTPRTPTAMRSISPRSSTATDHIQPAAILLTLIRRRLPRPKGRPEFLAPG